VSFAQLRHARRRLVYSAQPFRIETHSGEKLLILLLLRCDGARPKLQVISPLRPDWLLNCNSLSFIFVPPNIAGIDSMPRRPYRRGVFLNVGRGVSFEEGLCGSSGVTTSATAVALANVSQKCF
jgi:hypothetical protein